TLLYHPASSASASWSRPLTLLRPLTVTGQRVPSSQSDRTGFPSDSPRPEIESIPLSLRQVCWQRSPASDLPDLRRLPDGLDGPKRSIACRYHSRDQARQPDLVRPEPS